MRRKIPQLSNYLITVGSTCNSMVGKFKVGEIVQRATYWSYVSSSDPNDMIY
jgi:hypothetical protein